MRIKARHHLRDDTIKSILGSLRASFGESADAFFAKKTMEIAETDDGQEFVLVNGEPLLFVIAENEVFPTVRGALTMKFLRKRIVVDMGAVKFVAKGADIMSPGIVEAEPSIQKGDLVIIVDEVHKKPLAIGRALVNSDSMIGNKGKAIKSIHYVGDKIWNLEQQ